LTAFCDAISNLESTLGIPFLQLHDNFKPKDLDRLQDFIEAFPKGMPLAVEVRNQEWFNNSQYSDQMSDLLRKEEKIAIIVDAAGRRDLLHMRLTAPDVFIRYVGANHSTFYTRLADWVNRIKQWRKDGMRSLHFFVHQNIEIESPLLAAYFIKQLNRELDLDLKVPIVNTE
jgi:uncharacterized protein YecE (DUF72 family)